MHESGDEMKGRGFLQKLRWAEEEYGRANLWLYAASGTYYLFFSLGPLAVLFLGLLPWLPVTREALLDALFLYAPGPFQELMGSIISEVYDGSAAALGVGLAAELWSAGKFLSLLLRGIGQIYDGLEYGGYLRRRLMGALYTAALVALILGNLALLFFGEKLLLSAGYVPDGAGLWAVLLRARGLLFFAAVTVINALLFRYVPRRELRFRRQLPGAAFSAGSWLAFSRVYSWAVERFRFYSVYGGLAIVIISLYWMYWSLFLLFLGAWINSLREKSL